MADNNIIRIASVLATASAQAADFSTLLIVDTNHNSLSRTRLYTSTDYQDIVPVGSPLRRALDSAFSPQIKPPFVVAGRSKGTTIVTPTTVADTTAYEFNIEVLDGAIATASYITGVGEDAEVIATALKADIDAATDVAAHVNATVVGTGADAVLEISLVDAADDYRLYGESSNLGLTHRTTEDAATSLSAITDFYPNFTYVISTDHTPAYQAAMMAACEVVRKPYFTSSALIENINTLYDGQTAPAANDVAAVAAHNNRVYTHVMYHEKADYYPEAARVTRFNQLEPGTSDFQYKELSGFGVAQHPLASVDASFNRALTTGELVNLQSKNASTIVDEGGLAVVGAYNGQGNRVGTGDRIEHVVWGIYAESILTQRLRNLKRRKNKLGMNDSDINLVKSTMESWLRTQISQPGLAKAINPAARWVLEFPKARDLTFEDQSSGLLRSIRAIVYMDASIDAVSVVPLTLTFTDVAEA